MRQTLFTFFLFSFFSIITAQNEEKKKTKLGLTLSINDANSQMAYYGEVGLAIDANGNMLNAGKKLNRSLSLSIIPKYYISDQWLIRFEYGYTKIDLINSNMAYASPGSVSFNSTMKDAIKQRINRYIAGTQFTFFKNKRIESNGGASLQYIKYNKISREAYSENRDAASDSLIYWGKSHVTIPGGYAAGVGVFAGFNVFLHRHISLGAEFSSAFLYYNVGGQYTEEYSYQNLPSPPADVTNTIYNDSYKGFRFTKILSSFNISAWF